MNRQEATEFARQRGMKVRGLLNVKTMSAQYVKHLERMKLIDAGPDDAGVEELTDEQLRDLV
eukprot:CAMPEP_0170435894 /NCGR_PEP_ID=MMETSP0117_2-20130122/43847_1 /TAXON_ID=400756 /ORGANISM="Durinskia baltica, Strain CSIRO CS-38" /LENGTH=61 /DNA_ID=CAMNT_0010695885 /DNA_START=31 /DNA_END=213 /DNA_ORIENTATION=-